MPQSFDMSKDDDVIDVKKGFFHGKGVKILVGVLGLLAVTGIIVGAVCGSGHCSTQSKYTMI